jgi:hypothetical protein
VRGAPGGVQGFGGVEWHMNEQARQPAVKGCFFYGCLTFTLLLLVVGVATFFGVRYLQNILHNYTETSPAPLPQAVLTPDEMEALLGRLSAFDEAMLRGEGREPLVLSERELNALLRRRPELLEWSEFLYIQLEENQIRALISLPLEQITRGPFRSPRFEGRYLNAGLGLSFAISNAAPVIRIETATVKGEPVPDQIMDVLRQQNLAGEIEQVPGRGWRSIESVRVEKERVIIVPRGPG